MSVFESVLVSGLGYDLPPHLLQKSGIDQDYFSSMKFFGKTVVCLVAVVRGFLPPSLILL